MVIRVTPGANVIEAVPTRWFSGDYRLQQPHGTVAELDISAWREKAEFDVEGGRYQLDREGRPTRAFVLMRGGELLARAIKPSAFRSRFEVQFAGRTFELRREGWRSDFSLYAGTERIGSVRRAGAFTRRAIIELPDDWPLAAQVFVFWLALLIWNRQQAAAS
jgi:hypothetical protein